MCLPWLATAAGGQGVDSLLVRGRQFAHSPDLNLRMQAVRDLREAAQLSPERADVWLELSALQVSLGERDQARASLVHLAAITPDDARVWARLGDTHRWDWLATVDDSSYARAWRYYRHAVQLDTMQLAAWLGCCAMALGKGDLLGSREAAEGSIACAPDAPMSHLAFACVAYRLGMPELAEGAFSEAIPRLPVEIARRFKGVEVEAWRSTADVPEDGIDSSLVWSGSNDIPDPDLTTPWNEAALDFQFRVGLALLLLRGEYDSLRWDMRSELIARYGMPSGIHEMVGILDFESSLSRRTPVVYAPPPNAYPYHYQRWSYAALGMECLIVDQSLREQYEIRPDLEESQEPRPDLNRLRGRSDLVLSPDGLAVFRAMAPGVTSIPVSVLVSRFPAPSGMRLVAYVGASASPHDTLWGSMVVSDPSGTQRLASAEGRLRRSACDPTQRQLVQLSAIVPAGAYRVDLSVRSGTRRRGLARQRVTVPEPDSQLRLGDLVMLCGAPENQTSAGAILLDPEFQSRSEGRPDLSVYFELANLATGADGQKAFTYVYAIHALDDHGKETGPALIQASRSEHYLGDDRRQFMTVRCAGLKHGRYRLRIDVRDDNAVAAAARTLDFVRVRPGERGPTSTR